MSEKNQEIDGHYDGYEEPKNEKDVIQMDDILPNWLTNGMDETGEVLFEELRVNYLTNTRPETRFPCQRKTKR